MKKLTLDDIANWCTDNPLTLAGAMLSLLLIITLLVSFMPKCTKNCHSVNYPYSTGQYIQGNGTVSGVPSGIPVGR